MRGWAKTAAFRTISQNLGSGDDNDTRCGGRKQSIQSLHKLIYITFCHNSQKIQKAGIPLAKDGQMPYYYYSPLSLVEHPVAREVLFMRGKERRIKSVVLSASSLCTAVFSALFALGVAIGYCRALHFSAASQVELRYYFSHFSASRAQDVLLPDLVTQTLFAFFRAPLFAFFLGFASVGVVILPLLCAAQGFLYSFSLFCCALVMGRESFAGILFLFLPRLLTLVPCTLLLCRAAISNSCALVSFSTGKGKRVKAVRYGSPYFIRFALCCAVLLLAALFELWLAPRVLASAG